MITFEHLMMSFINCDIPDDAIIEVIELNHKRKRIEIKARMFNDDGEELNGEYSIPYNEENLDGKLENNAEQEIVK